MAESYAAGKSKNLIMGPADTISLQVKANEQHGLNIIATLNNRSKSVLDMEKGKDKMTSQTSSLIE
jgi:hypothetical protein